MASQAHLYIVVKQDDVLSLPSRNTLQVAAAMRQATACVPLNLVALQGVAQLFIHLLLLSIRQHHDWPAFSPLCELNIEAQDSIFGHHKGF